MALGFGDDLPNFKIEPPVAPGSTPQAALSVSALTVSIREALERRFGTVWVAGEISNLRTPGSGHLYFTLKDAGATLAAVLFRAEAARLKFAPHDGQAVLARGALTVYEARGQYQLQVSTLQPRGLGTLQQRFDELKLRLLTEGLFAPERKRPLPVFPVTLGIVTSLQGAVLQDMRRILARRAPGVRLQIRGVRVQGPSAAPEIAEAIAAFNRDALVDVLVVARGGGSLEDLWAFNEEVVARALAASRIPTVSAVGHETDFTIADFVADLRAPTPSAAAELLVRDYADWREDLAARGERMQRQVRHGLTQRRRHLHQLATHSALREPRRVVRRLAQRLDDLGTAFREGTGAALRARLHPLRVLETRLRAHHPRRELRRSRERLEALAGQLRALGPQATLDRGFALVLDRAGQPLLAADPAQIGTSVRVVLSRGVLRTKIDQVDPTGTLTATKLKIR